MFNSLLTEFDQGGTSQKLSSTGGETLLFTHIIPVPDI